MSLAKIDSISTTTVKEHGVASIVDWFEQHILVFYTLGKCYLHQQKQMEELFYRTITQVQKEWPRSKEKTSFDMWVTSVFIDHCRALSSDSSFQDSEENDSYPDILKVLNQLEVDKKEAVILTYIKEFSYKETAQLLNVSPVKVKELLFFGIQSIRNAIRLESTFSGCKEYQQYYIDYLERAMDRPEKINFEIHIYHCEACQEDLASFQDAALNLLSFANKLEDFQIPSSFMKNVKDRVVEEEKGRKEKKKKRKRIGFVFASVFGLLLGIGFFTGFFTSVYYSWTEEDPELRAFLQEGLGQRLNLEAESDGVKIRMKTAIADDLQTLIFYEIEDTNEDKQYLMNYDDGVFVENEYEIMKRENYPRYYPPDLKSDINKQKKNIFHGKMSLRPIIEDNGTIKLNIDRLQSLIRDSSGMYGFGGYESNGELRGEWSFEIPVTKKPSVEYELNEKTVIEGVPVRFDKLTVAPTATILQFGISNEQRKKQIVHLNFNHLELNKTVVKPDLYGSSYSNIQHDMNWTTYYAYFSPAYENKPKEVNVQFESAYLSVEDTFIFGMGSHQEYPQTIDYAGSTISIDKKEAGQSTELVISNHEIENRAFEWLQFQIVNEDGNTPISMEMSSEGVLVDKHGVVYDENKVPFSYEEIEHPRYFYTVQSIRLNDKNAIPKTLQIYGYNTTKYVDDVVKLSLKKVEED